MENTIGIDSEKLKKLILELYEYRDNISKKLDKIVVLMEDTKTYYQSKDGDAIREKFNLFVPEFEKFLTNIRSYSEDLEIVLFNYKNVFKNNLNVSQVIEKKGN